MTHSSLPTPTSALVVSVSKDSAHRFSKPPVASVTLRAGWGVEGDVHAGTTVQHRYLVKKDPTRANLTQVHFMAEELFAELGEKGFDVSAGQLGENITTRGVDLINLPLGTLLGLGSDAVVEITGLRSPCSLINQFQHGLMKACVSKDPNGTVIRKAGIMGIVIRGGSVAPGDEMTITLPEGEHQPLGVV
ncbi:MAG TPA: MOSC domain-containing protein [Glaciihabitans sp.]|jgi:MOSC domain-containing protein YiiM|nr:MOSC domain-containing protein [Glaciihabitans sp.]